MVAVPVSFSPHVVFPPSGFTTISSLCSSWVTAHAKSPAPPRRTRLGWTPLGDFTEQCAVKGWAVEDCTAEGRYLTADYPGVLRERLRADRRKAQATQQQNREEASHGIVRFPKVIARIPPWRETKQSSWIATARFAPLAMTTG